MFCPSCGTATDPSSRFCANCGAQSTPESAPGGVTPPVPGQAQWPAGAPAAAPQGGPPPGWTPPQAGPAAPWAGPPQGAPPGSGGWAPPQQVGWNPPQAQGPPQWNAPSPQQPGWSPPPGAPQQQPGWSPQAGAPAWGAGSPSPGWAPAAPQARAGGGALRIIAVIVGVFVLLGGLAKLVPGETNIAAAATARGVADKTYEPTDRTESFTSSDTIYCCIQFKNAKAGKTTISTKWYRGTEYLDETKLDVGRDGDGWLHFNVPAARLSSGSYKIDCLLNGDVKKSVSFTIK